jgi:3-oxoacyl-[acyl-carrier protein] reductase
MGYNILCNYRSNDAGAYETQQAVEKNGVTCTLLKWDVANKDATEHMLGNWLDNNKDKHIEVLVNNAGITADTLFLMMTEEKWKSVLNTSLDAFFYVTRTVLTGMLSRRFGRIINMVSLSGLKGVPGQTNYSAAKAGLIGATKALAQEVARRGVTVNAVAPGFIKTDMTENLDEKALSDMIPMRRFGSPEEVAEAVGFLASHGASYISGEVLSVNGALYS